MRKLSKQRKEQGTHRQLGTLSEKVARGTACRERSGRRAGVRGAEEQESRHSGLREDTCTSVGSEGEMTRLPPRADPHGVARQSCKPAPGTCLWGGRLDRPPGRSAAPNLQAPGLGRKCPGATGRSAGRAGPTLPESPASFSVGPWELPPRPPSPTSGLGEGLPPPAQTSRLPAGLPVPVCVAHWAASASQKEACEGLSPTRTLPSPPRLCQGRESQPRSREFGSLCSPLKASSFAHV